MEASTLEKVEFDAVRRILAEYCRCALGKNLARRITPSRNAEVIDKWLAQTAQMVDVLVDTGLPPTGGVKDIAEPLARAEPAGGATGDDFADIAATLDAAGQVRRFLLALPEQRDLLIDLAGPIEDFQDEIDAINAIVAPDGSILDEASAKLASIRRSIQDTSNKIHDVIHRFVRRGDVARLLQDTRVTVHGDRFVLPVKAENRGRIPGVVHRESNTGATVFVEPEASVELNNHLMDLRNDEQQEIQRLLNALAVTIAARRVAIQRALRALAQVDLLAGKAQYAYQFRMHRPELSDPRHLELRQARHPLLVEQAHRQEKMGLPPEKRHAVVPVDVRLGSDFDILVITGSNTGGKTVALKTVALLVLMAQSGLHIPAERGSKLPVFQDVFIDIGDEQSLQQSLSTFGGHVHRLRRILQKARPDCLVLLDELGSGTDPDEGGAIGQAVLDELLKVGCPVMATTHLSVLKAYAFRSERVDNASVEFDTATLSPTYHLRIGTPGESHALTVAQKLGMPKSLIASAKRYLSGAGRQFHKAIRATTAAREDAEDARDKARVAQLAAETQQELLQNRSGEVQKLQEKFLAWLAALPQLRPGEDLYVPSLRRTGQLIRLELHRGVALIESDNVHVEVPLAELMPNFGQEPHRKDIANLRQRLGEQVAAAEAQREAAEQRQNEIKQAEKHQKDRAKQFDRWLGLIGRLKVGQEVPIARKPGKGTVEKVDLAAMKVTVKTRQGQLDLPLQDVYPQSGPFARPAPGDGHAGGKRGPKAGRRQAGKGKDQRQKQPEKNRPIERGPSSGKKAQANRQQVINTPPGESVFVVPFNKEARLVRIDTDKDQAVVVSGIFEMQVAIADLRTVRS